MKKIVRVADDDLTNDDNDIQSIHEFGAPQLRDNDIAHITDFKAADDTAQTSEYSYNTILNTRTGKFIDQIWAGPHHWKLKFLRRSAVRFSGQQRSITSSKEHKQARKRAEPEPIDFTKHVEVDFSKKLVIKRKAPTVDINKITLPLLDPLCARMLEKINELMLKPGVCPVKKKVKKDSEANNLDYELNPYKYENPNDSQYCSQYHDDDNGALDGGHTGMTSKLKNILLEKSSKHTI
ncbi:hypothetical protein JTB14_008535 [Gonioctena quinquepunctata]|nr:hypothetical protein JTB14_008535 [Gonioctena quinquepunctata]